MSKTLTPPTPAPERLAPCPDCGAPLLPDANWPANNAVGEVSLRGVNCMIRCSRCDSEFGPLVFIARSADHDNVVTITPDQSKLRDLAVAAGLAWEEDNG